MDLSVVVLAAGQGTRMRSDLPKVLHPLAGRPLLAHVLDTAFALAAERVVVVHGHGGDAVRAAVSDRPVVWVEQAEQRGTGHAVAQALRVIPDRDVVLVLYGDVPMITAETCRALVRHAAGGSLALLGMEPGDPSGYGRILRDGEGRVTGIVEEKDATPEQRAIGEVNTGFLAAPRALLAGWVEGLSCDNAQGEYYLTDVVAAAAAAGVHVEALVAADPEEVLGVNDRSQLARLERSFQRRQARELMAAGLGLLDPERFDLRGRLEHGRDVSIDVNVVLEGRVVLGDRVRIGPGCVLRNVSVAADAVIDAHSVLEDCEIGPGCRVGPFARIRPGTRLAAAARIGNFVEVKNASIGEGSKINHLSYVGDARVGRDVNIGAGTITCNYDGAAKHRTVIGDRAFIGSDTQLVAPVEVGEGATIGAGSTITRDAPPEQLTLSRARQVSVEGWQRPRKTPGG